MNWWARLFGRRRKDPSPSHEVPVDAPVPHKARPRVTEPDRSDAGIGADIARFADQLMAQRDQPRPRIDRTDERFIDTATLKEALAELGQMLRDQGQTVDLAVYGGSCLMLASNFRTSSGDVDAVTFSADWSIIQEPARAIAYRRGWPEDWINNNVQNFLGKNPLNPDHHILFGSYPDTANPGLRVFVPEATYALAMKLRSMRIDLDNDKDLDDIVNLMIAAEIDDKVELVEIAKTFYPEKEFGGKLYTALDELWAEYQTARESTKDDPPRYLG